nr:sulfite exporter TauE/SafE family protein [Motilibacter aurantiacus]
MASGVAAGGINTLVGSGTLVTFPTLLAVGLSPVTANATNTIGLVMGSVSGAWGYRRELAGQRARLLRLGPLSALGGLIGGVLLLVLPDDAFEAVVPVLVAIACVLVLLQPWLARRMAARDRRPAHHGGAGLASGVVLTGVYGGYFGAAQGVLLLGLMGSLLDESLHRVNAAKNVLAAIVNGVAAVLFAFAAPVDWAVVPLLAAGALLGGALGGRYGRRIPAPVLRWLIVAVGVVAIVQLVL